MTKVYHVTLTKLGQETLEHSAGSVEVRLIEMIESASVELNGTLVFRFHSGAELVYAPGMWSGYTTSMEE